MSDSVLHSLFFDVAVNAGYAAAIEAVPVLGVPPLSWLFKAALNWFAGIIYTQLARFVAFQIISFETEAENNAYKEAVTNLAAAQESLDEKKVSDAMEDFKNTLGALIHWDGA